MTYSGIIVAGIGTDVGKTVASAVLCEALKADYWKPVASGSDDGPLDDQILAHLIVDGAHRVRPSAYVFSKSLSPHVAAELDGAFIDLNKIELPVTKVPLVVELAGGVAVPLNDSSTNLDLIQKLGLPVVIVSRHYLGSINHTLLTIEALRARGAEIAGVLFNGEELPDTERIITKLGQTTNLGRIPRLTSVTREAIAELVASVPHLRTALLALTTKRQRQPTQAEEI